MANKAQKGAVENIEALTKSQAFFEKHGKTVIIAVVVIIVAILAVFAYKTYVVEPKADKASTELALAQELFGQGQYEQALNGTETVAGFVKVASDYSGTDAANLAKLYAGLCYYNLEKWNEAVENLKGFSGCGDDMITPAAIAALANAYVQTDQLDKAVDTFKKAAKEANSKSPEGANLSLSPIFLLQAGQILESQDKAAEALAIYKDIKANYLNADIVQSGEIDKYIERATK